MKNIIALIFFTLAFSSTNAAAYEDQRIGLAELANEIKTLVDMTYVIEAAPKSPGRYEVDFQAVRNELNVIRRGVLNASKNPVSIQKKLSTIQSAIEGDYLK